MRIFQISVLCAAVLFSSQLAFAFEESQVGASPDGVVVDQSQLEAAGVEFSAGKGKNSKNKGTEVRIPGIGSLGVLPKMDFGLDLLYGAASDSETVDPKEEGISNDGSDLRIRGSVKHRF